MLKKKRLNTFRKKYLKKYAHNIFRLFSKTRAFQSQVIKKQGFHRLDSGFLKNGHFINVQKSFPPIKPRKVKF